MNISYGALYRAGSILSQILLLAVLLCPASRAGDFSFQPSLSVSEEYTDNVFETRDYRRTDYITRFLPGLTLRYNAPFWDWDIAYNFDYRLYALNSRTNESTHNLQGTGRVRIIDDLLFLDLSDTYSRVSLNVARDYTRESLNVNQTDSNTFTANPYFVLHPGPKITVRTGYRYTNVWYRSSVAQNRTEHVGYLDTTYDFSTKFNLTGSYTYTHQDSVNPYDRHQPTVGFRYEYRDRSSIFGQVGYTWFNSRNRRATNYPYWNAGITHAFDTLSVSLTTGVQYPEDPLSGVTRETDYAISVNKELGRGSIGLSLSYANFSGTNVDTDNRYGMGLTSRYDLTGKLSGTLDAGVDLYGYDNVSGHTRRIYVTPGLGYSLPWDTSLNLTYNFINYYSTARYSDNYTVNRVILEARKTF